MSSRLPSFSWWPIPLFCLSLGLVAMLTVAQPLFASWTVKALGVDGDEWLAQDVEVFLANEDTSESSSDPLCIEHLMEEVPAVIDDYQYFLNQYFLSDSPSSGQLEVALDYYRLVDLEIREIYEEGLALDGFSTFDTAYEQVTQCARTRDQYLDTTYFMLQFYMQQSAISKRNFEMVDGLKAFNESLDAFSERYQATFPQLFDSFDSALPCYARQCITQ